jgi:hypothetical protein
LSGRFSWFKIPSMARKRKARMGRPPKRASERKSGYLSFHVEKPRLEAYQNAAEAKFKGNVSDFLRAAADALAEQIANEPDQTKSDAAAERPKSP